MPYTSPQRDKSLVDIGHIPDNSAVTCGETVAPFASSRRIDGKQNVPESAAELMRTDYCLKTSNCSVITDVMKTHHLAGESKR